MFSEKAVINADFDGINPAVDKKKTVEKRERLEKNAKTIGPLTCV